MCYGILLAAALAYESDHHALRNVGQRHMMLEEGGEEEWSARSRGSSWRSHNATAFDIEIDPQGRRFSRRQNDFRSPIAVKLLFITAGLPKSCDGEEDK